MSYMAIVLLLTIIVYLVSMGTYLKRKEKLAKRLSFWIFVSLYSFAISLVWPIAVVYCTYCALWDDRGFFFWL